MRTSSMRIFAPSIGCSTMMRARFSRSRTARTTGSIATHVAKRASPSIIDISPSVLPASTVAMSCGVLCLSRLRTSTFPSTSMSMKSPASPSRMISTPGGALYMSMNWVRSLTSPVEKFSSRGHFGMRAWIWLENRVASPSGSSCARRFDRDEADLAMRQELCLAPRLHALRQRLEQSDGGLPAEAWVGHALPEAQLFPRLEVLAAFHQVRLHHDAENPPLTATELAGDVAGHVHLPLVLLRGVRVRAVDHQALGQLRLLQLLARGAHRSRIVVRLLAAAQDDVAILVAARLHDRHLAALVHGKEMVLLARGEQRIHRDLDVTVGTVLEPDRRRQAGGELPMDLALGGARADRAPGDKIADVLRRNDVEELASRRHAAPVDAHQQVPGDAQPLV